MKRTPTRKRIPLFHAHTPVGSSPGTLNQVANALPTSVEVIAYGPETMVEAVVDDLATLAAHREQYPVVWINVVGLAGLETLTALGEFFDLHRLAMEDALNVTQRPKLDVYESHQYAVARVPVSEVVLQTEQLSMFVGQNFLVTVVENPTKFFDSVRERIRAGRPRLRQGGVDYLTYALLDALVDSYFPLLERFSQQLFDLENELLSDPRRHHLYQLHEIKRDLTTLRRYVPPLRDLITAMMRPDNPFLKDKTRIFMADCHDHAQHAVELVESQGSIAGDLINLYLNLVSQRMNEVMKVLTIIATIFIPLSFIAGVYGMNFNPGVSAWNMPELSWRFGYPFALGVMAVCGGGMLAWFIRKGWFR